MEDNKLQRKSYKFNAQYILDELENIKIAIAELEDLKYIPASIQEIKDTLEDMKKDFVKRAEFAPIKAIVYGMVGMILTSFIGGVIFMVFK